MTSTASTSVNAAEATGSSASPSSSAASIATTRDRASSSTSQSPAPSASVASSVFSAPIWWPQLSFGAARRGGGTATSMASATGTSSRVAPSLANAPRAGGGGGPSRQPDPGLLPPSSPSSPTTDPERLASIAEARTALEASMANILDREFVPRATALHRGERVIKKQQADVLRATASLQQANRQLEAVVEDVSWKLREVGDLQNWTELLEQRFLVVEETLRLAAEGESDDDDNKGSCSSCRCSECCSDCGESDWDGSDVDEDETRDADTRKQGHKSIVDGTDGPDRLPIVPPKPGIQRPVEYGALVSTPTVIDPCHVPLPREVWSPIDIELACQVPLPGEEPYTM